MPVRRDHVGLPGCLRHRGRGRHQLRDHRRARQRGHPDPPGDRPVVRRIRRSRARGGRARGDLGVPVPRAPARGRGAVPAGLGDRARPQHRLHRQPHERAGDRGRLDRDAARGADVRDDGHHARALQDRQRPADDDGARVRPAAGRARGLDRDRGGVPRRLHRDRGRDGRDDGPARAADDAAQQLLARARHRRDRGVGHAGADHPALDRDRAARHARGRHLLDRAGEPRAARRLLRRADLSRAARRRLGRHALPGGAAAGDLPRLPLRRLRVRLRAGEPVQGARGAHGGRPRKPCDARREADLVPRRPRGDRAGRDRARDGRRDRDAGRHRLELLGGGRGGEPAHQRLAAMRGVDDRAARAGGVGRGRGRAGDARRVGRRGRVARADARGDRRLARHRGGDRRADRHRGRGAVPRDGPRARDGAGGEPARRRATAR